MSSPPLPRRAARPSLSIPAFRRPRWRRPDLRAITRRLLHFWIVWSALLLVHEAGHALTASRQGLDVSRVTVGAGPVLWRGEHGDMEVVLRLVPLAGITTLGGDAPHAAPAEGGAWRELGRQIVTLAGGVLATLGLAVVVAAAVAARERSTGRRWVFGRVLVADALVLTVFNFLPVPPLDGGRAVLGAIAALRGAPLSGDALFWVQLGGLALAVVPMALWTRWTSRIDRTALWWGAPPPRIDAASADVTAAVSRVTPPGGLDGRFAT